jgi:excinuclease ABC subunit B
MGNPDEYRNSILRIGVGEIISRNQFLFRLVEILYARTEGEFLRGTFRVKGDTVDIFLAYADFGYRIIFFGDEIEEIHRIDPWSGKKISTEKMVAIFPANLFVTGRETMQRAISDIQADLVNQISYFGKEGRLTEAERIKQRTEFDLEMMRELGYCSGIENYSRYFDARKPGQRPFCLLDFFPEDFLMVVDESHATMPQIKAMYGGDRSRKESLVEYGFRLPSAMDNRPLKFQEFEDLIGQTIYVSATPSDYELKKSDGVVVEQVIRPTGLLDPLIEVRPTKNQIDDLLDEVNDRIKKNERVLITTLTKRMAEELSKYLDRVGIKCRYIHSEIKTFERVEILRELRLGVIDVLVGVNLLREGLDLPEVSLVAIMDADKEGFLRDIRSLIQTIGRAARNENGKVLMYADKMTGSMDLAISETNRRRSKQMAYNEKHGITPKTIMRSHDEIMEQTSIADRMAKPTKNYLLKPGEQIAAADPLLAYMSKAELNKQKETIKKEMEKSAKELDFPLAARFRDELLAIEKLMEEK